MTDIWSFFFVLPILLIFSSLPMIPLDYHIHSTFSADAVATPEQQCLRAIELGIPEIGFSEHWDVGPYETVTRYMDPQAWWQELERLRCLFAGQLVIRAGIEIAEPHLYQQDTAAILGRLPFDYIIGSVHWVGKNFMFDNDYFSRHTAEEVYPAYFSELEKLAATADIDIVAHFDIPARNAASIIGYDPALYETAIKSVLEVVISRGLALDVNVAGLRKPSQILMPAPLILHWYKEMGGERVTLGSDAHTTDQLGLHLDKALDALRKAGITHVTQFERRVPCLLPL